jgi:hypothetical protein
MEETGMTRRGMSVLATVVVAAGLVLCGCTAPSSTGSTASPGSAAGARDDTQSLSPKDAVAKVMADPKALPVLATSKGTIETGTGAGTSAVIAQVLEVRSEANSTLVVWRLKSATGGSVDTASFQLAYPPLMDTRLLGVVDPATKTTFRPYTYVPANGDGRDLDCACSTLPQSVDGSGQVLYALVPSLPKSVKKVEITIPGFATTKGISVERARA